MALPTPEVLENLDKLITAVTGFTDTQENFEPCRRYCLSHFVHHIYSSVNKSTVRKTIDDLENRFYTHGHFELSRALKTQVDHFLSHQETFKVNPECQIEWGLLSLVSSLASNLTKLHNVPPLLPVTEASAIKDDFDWGTYLKEGLPVCNYDTDSDSLLSLSSDNEQSLSKSIQSSSTEAILLTENTQKTEDFHEKRALVKIQTQKRDKRNWLLQDLTKKKDFATKWQQLNYPNDPFFLVSEKEAVEFIFNSLMTGESFDGLKNAAVCFLGKETFQNCLDFLRPYVEATKSINDYIASVEVSETSPVVALVYASCLRKALMRYELKILDASQENPTLMRLIEIIKPCLPFILGLSSVHYDCTFSTSEDNSSWKISLRILAGLYNAMITHHLPELRCLLVGMFLQCHAVYGRIMDTILTSSAAVDPFQEFYITRDSDDCVYSARTHESILPFVEIISKQVCHSSASLSLLYQMNRFNFLGKFDSINAAIYESLKKYFWVEVEKKEETDLHEEMMKLGESGSVDFSEVSRWLLKTKCMIPVYKIIETALQDAVQIRLDVVRKSAMAILVEEMSVQRHMTLLRHLYLCNDASLLEPFLKIFFHEGSCWSNADYLTMLLRECIATDFADLCGNISVVVHVVEGQVHQNIIQAINSLEINYQVAYPLSLLVTSTVLAKYNRILRILLKIKWAHTLSYLRFPDKNTTPHVAFRCIMHRLQILRFSCLTDLHVISNYFMAQVTATISKKCEDYSDVQSLIQEHEQLVERIHSRCMLSEGDQHYALIFDAMLPLVVDLRRCWLLEEINIVAKLKLMENIYRGTHAKLRRLMVYLEKETYVPLVAKLREESMSVTHQTQLTKFTSIR